MAINLADWASIAEIAGAAAVTLSLIFVGVQIRKNTIATQAATLQNSVGFDVQLLTAVGATEESAAALYRFSFDPGSVSESQRLQGLWLFTSTVRHWENLYLQHLAGTLSADGWRAREPAVRALVLCPGWDEYMSSVFGNFMGGPFMEFADRVRAETARRITAGPPKADSGPGPSPTASEGDPSAGPSPTDSA